MKFSIIIPTFNSGEYIEACLDSISRLDYPKDGYEVIIVDGGSRDSTLDMIRQYKTRLVRTDNASISQNRNIAAKESRGNFLVFIDSDCVIRDDYLKTAEKVLSKYDCTGSFYKPVRNASWVAKGWLMLESKKRGHSGWIVGGNMAVARDIFMRLTGFDNNLKTSEDVDFCCRLDEHGYTLFNEPQLAVFHLGQADSLIKFFRKEMWRGNSMVKIFKKHWKKELVSFTINIYYLFVLILLSLSLFFLSPLFTGTIALMAILPAGIISLIKAARLNRLGWIFHFWILQLTYHIARAYSIIRYSQFRDLF